MKTIKKQVLLVLLAIVPALTLSCSELDETVYSSIFTTNFYKTASDAEAGLAASAGSLINLYGFPLLAASDFAADQSYPRAVVGRNTLTLFTYDPYFTAQRNSGRHETEGPQGVWRYSYKGIENANWIIEKVPAIQMDMQRRTEILAEAYALRGFYHWTLTKTFNEIPLKTKASSSEAEALVAKSPRVDVYKQIYSDLDQAVAGLPSYSANLVKGRPSKEAIQGLYAKVALYNEDWAKSLQLAQAVISSGKYSLMPNVLDVFDVDKEDAARAENMWAVEAERLTPGRWLTVMGIAGPRNSSGIDYAKVSYGSWFAYQSFFDSFDPKDKRRALLDTTYRDVSGKIVPQKDITPVTPKGVLIRKYRDPNSIAEANNCNFPIIRLADVYLIAAEAEARQNGPTATAYGYINTVRKRAGLADLTPGLSKDAFIAAVLQERSWELFAEADRWYDLTRTNTFLTVIPKVVNDVYPTRSPQAKHRYYPIPLEEIQANPKLTQNPGWE
jgi:hypothetical protein